MLLEDPAVLGTPLVLLCLMLQCLPEVQVDPPDRHHPSIQGLQMIQLLQLVRQVQHFPLDLVIQLVQYRQ